jgi:TDG/mug DNA glycosylase family protein
MLNTIHCFAPIADSHSEILILGSIPGVQSLLKNQYYGHDRNSFWRVIYALYGAPYDEHYDRRIMFLRKHRIALWDVIQSCQRQGSLDTNIKQPVINDFPRFFAEYPRISRVFFNGRKAYALFKRHVGFNQCGLRFNYLGSTSPAHAKSLEEKVAEWRRILE